MHPERPLQPRRTGWKTNPDMPIELDPADF
jgi:hypothetical protein